MSCWFFGQHIQSSGEFMQRSGYPASGRVIILQTIGATAFKKELFIVPKGKVPGKWIWIWARLYFTSTRHKFIHTNPFDTADQQQWKFGFTAHRTIFMCSISAQYLPTTASDESDQFTNRRKLLWCFFFANTYTSWLMDFF